MEAVATPSVRPCEYATRARAGTLVRRARFDYDDFVGVLKCDAIKENAGQLKYPHSSLLFEYFPQDTSLTPLPVIPT